MDKELKAQIMKTYARSAKVPVKDFAEVLNDNIK